MPPLAEWKKPLAALAATGGAFVLWKHWAHHKRLPRGYSAAKNVASLPEHDGPNNRDGFAKKKIPKDLDAIVIGSGIGGLACAALMARAGKRVLVLEQHYIAGGATHSFEDHGYEFDVGIHYIGNIKKRQKYLDLISDTPIEWDQMGRDDLTREATFRGTGAAVSDAEAAAGQGLCYDELKISDWETIYLRSGADNYVDEMVRHFPGERAAVEKWVKMCRDASGKDLFFNLKIAEPRWLARLINLFASSKFFDMTRQTALDAAKALTPNTRLQAALLGQFGDYGVVPSKESFFLHASVANHYFGGGWYPRGGSSVIANGIVPVIEKAGGRVLVRKAVKRILLDASDAAVGVEMENGVEIRAPMVVSGAGVFNTYRKFLPAEKVPDGILANIERVGPSVSMVYLFVGMEGTPEELGLRSTNIWRWPNEDYDTMMSAFKADPKNAPIPMFLGFPCAKDSTWAQRYPGKSNAVIITLANYEWFEEWKDLPQGKRGPEYEKFKDMFKERILEEGLYKYYPKTRGKVDFSMTGSSLTFNHYLGSHYGEVYGLEGAPERFQVKDWLRPRTDIKGLYMTGQDVTTLGVTGALMSGILTAHSCLGYGGVSDLISGRNLIEDIWHLDPSLKDKQKKEKDGAGPAIG